jgi:hypothetical protein
MVVKCGLADAAVLETPVAAASGESTVADMVYFDDSTGHRIILEVSVATVSSDSSLATAASGGLSGLTDLLRSREETKRSHKII